MQPARADIQRPVRTTTVLLEHTLNDGSTHLDWLIERPNDPSEHRLIAYRCDSDPLHADPTSPWIGERIPDHRAQYLTHQGEISNNRGTVRRLWSHACTLTSELHGSVSLNVHTGPNPHVLGVSQRPDGLWILTRESPASPAP